MRGGFWPVLNRIVTAIVWNGIQLYWGGQTVKIMLGSIIGRPWLELPNTLPESANVDTASLISFFVFLVIFLPILMIPPEKLLWPLRVRFSFKQFTADADMRKGDVRYDAGHDVCLLNGSALRCS
jgi:nucleobase:cation symporter-1, NCS1 family